MTSSFGRDVHRLLQAAEAGQKADIMTYTSGHLGPRSLNQSQPHGEKRQSFWGVSQSQEESPSPPTRQQTQRAKSLTCARKTEMKGPRYASPALMESEVPRSRRSQATDASSKKGEALSLPKIVRCSSNSLPLQHKKSSSCLEGKHTLCSSLSDQQGLSNEDQRTMKRRFDRQDAAKQGSWAGTNVAEMLEGKLEKELRKLSAQSGPSRDRLVVFSDVFEDVCEGSPVFGRILREIKTDYDLYVNHLMASHSSPHDKSPDSSLQGLGNGKVREMELEDAEKEVCMLEQEAGRALEENLRARSDLQNVPAVTSPEDSDMQKTSLSGLQDRDVQSKRLQVMNTWREIQELEEEIKEKLVSTATTAATERHIKSLKTEIVRLIASNDRLKTTNEALENNITMAMNREKANKAMRRMLWEEVHGDLQKETE